ncbi:MAG: nucleotidyl transferase AbiEii/AbiGii toxin family protein [Woeseiaceae bacterium]
MKSTFKREIDKTLGIPTLRRECAIAEKFLANADRGLDESILSRDLVDLFFIAASGRSNSYFVKLEKV